MKIVHISDSHICLPQPDGSHRLDDLKQAVDKIQKMGTPPDLIVHSGDIVHNGRLDEYRAAYEILSELPAPLYVIPGNKDRRSIMRKVFHAELGDSANKAHFQYVIENSCKRIIMLDTLDEGERWGTLCSSRLQIFRDMLARDKTTDTIIFMHHPPFDVVEAPRPFQFDRRETVELFEIIVKENPQISRIFCGHSHRYGAAVIGTTKVSAIPSIAIDLRWGDYGKEKDDTAIFEVYNL